MAFSTNLRTLIAEAAERRACTGNARLVCRDW